MTRISFFLFLISLSACLTGCEDMKKNKPRNSQQQVMVASLENDILKYWYPRVIDSLYGGYTERYFYNWEEDSIQDKYLVYEARHLWTTSMLYRFFPNRPEFLRYAEHGFKFLQSKMWDSEKGGFYMAVDRKGNPLPDQVSEKRIYGQAFALYGLSCYYIASGNEDALDLARKEFNWLEKGAHDAKDGGYWELLYRDGSPVKETDSIPELFWDRPFRGLKDFNSSIHVLEALTSLYEAWPDSLVKARLMEMLNIVDKTMIDPKAYLAEYFYGDWQRVSGNIMAQKTGDNKWLTEPVTFGHDIETAYLLLDAAQALGQKDSMVLPTAIRLTEHTIRYGRDSAGGGIFNEGIHVSPEHVNIIDRHKAWWAEIEAMNTYLLMAEKVPQQKDRYYELFMKQWNYIDNNLIDHENGGFFNNGIDTDPGNKLYPKAHAWKASYHTVRGYLNCIRMLNEVK